MPNDTAKADTPEGLTPSQCRAAEALARGASASDAARAAGVHRGTVWRWRQTAPFAAYVSRLHAEAKAAARGALLSLVTDAVEAVGDVLASETASDADRLRAARYVLDTVQDGEVGETDPRQIIRAQVQQEGEQMLSAGFDMSGAQYREKCERAGIEP